LEYETERQARLLDAGEPVIQETRTWDEGKGITLSLRSKEDAHDYRYFPEPDLVPLIISREWVEEIRRTLPEMPAARRQRYLSLGLTEYDAGVLTATKELSDFFDEALKAYSDAKTLANWVMGEFLRLLNAKQLSVTEAPVKPAQLAQLLNLIEKGTISGKIGKSVIEDMFESGKDPEVIVKEKGLAQISDTGALLKLVEEVIAANPQSVEDYKAGKERAIGFLVGQIMKKTKGQANPGVVNNLLKEQLNKL